MLCLSQAVAQGKAVSTEAAPPSSLASGPIAEAASHPAPQRSCRLVLSSVHLLSPVELCGPLRYLGKTETSPRASRDSS